MATTPNASRRQFIERACLLGATGAAGPLAMSLAAMAETAASGAADYKAIVCVFLYGGNDPYNTVVPYDAESYGRYARARPDICLPRAQLAQTALSPRHPLPAGQQFALAPGLGALKPLFDQGRLAIQFNVGPLVVPITKAQYLSGSAPLPPKLFSHNDQQSYWQACAFEGAGSGWAGRLADLYAAGNGQASFTCVAAGDNAVMLAGRHVAAYRVGAQGSTPIELLRRDLYGSSDCTTLLRELITEQGAHLLQREHARIVARSIAADAHLRTALADTQVEGNFDGPLAQQFKIVARMIAARERLGARRQVFFVSQNGYDTHAGLNTDHPRLLQELAASLAAFQHALDRLGVGAAVTTFTASEFGRTLASNGNGSDHGWGSHHFVLGTAVKGGRFYGLHPEVALDGPGFVDHGRLLPSVSVEQFGATLGAWFGAPAAGLDLAFPNLRNFSEKSLSFV